MKQAIVQYGFLEEGFYEKLRDTFPNPPESGFRSHRDLSHIDPAFKTLSYHWRQFRNLICCDEFWEPIVEMFPSLSPDPMLFNIGLSKKNEGVDGCSVPKGEVQYPRMDIGWAGEGYGIENGGKGNHIDNKTRVISGLLYFTDQSEMEGGEFELTDKDGNTLQQFAIRENMCIMSVQNQDGWHRVNPIRKVNGWRRSVYFALSDTRNIFGR